MRKFHMCKKDAEGCVMDAKDKAENLVNRVKLTEYLHRKEREDEKKTCILWIFAALGAIAAVAAIAFAVYKFVAPDKLEDYDDFDFDDEFTDDDVVDEETKPEA